MKIVVAIDGSHHAQRALAWAVREATAREASLTALHAFGVRRFTGPLNREVSLEPERRAAEELVHSALEKAGAESMVQVAVDVTAVMGRGAADAVLRHGRDADLIVLGSRGLGGFPGLLLGSVSQQVAAHAQVPVAVIPPGDEAAPPDTTSVVIGVDGSASSRRALRWGAEEADLHGVEPTAVYVHHPMTDLQLSADFTSEQRTQLSRLEERVREHAQLSLARIVDESLGVPHRAVALRVVDGTPAQVLSQDAATPRSILVVGSRGHGGFAGLLLGSVSQQCLHHAAGPVVVTPTV